MMRAPCTSGAQILCLTRWCMVFWALAAGLGLAALALMATLLKSRHEVIEMEV